MSRPNWSKEWNARTPTGDGDGDGDGCCDDCPSAANSGGSGEITSTGSRQPLPQDIGGGLLVNWTRASDPESGDDWWVAGDCHGAGKIARASFNLSLRDTRDVATAPGTTVLAELMFSPTGGNPRLVGFPIGSIIATIPPAPPATDGAWIPMTVTSAGGPVPAGGTVGIALTVGGVGEVFDYAVQTFINGTGVPAPYVEGDGDGDGDDGDGDGGDGDG